MSSLPDRPALLRWIAEAGLAPSLHNVQPACWRVAGDHLELVQRLAVRTPVCDPLDVDARRSLGCALEGLALAAGRDGWRMGFTPAPRSGPAPDLIVHGEVRFAPGGAPDPLAAHVVDRRTWRGVFAPRAATAPALTASPDIRFLTDAGAIAQLAELYDAIALRQLSDDAYRAELHGWMRFSTRHPGWGRDGLNAQALALSGMEAAGAALVLGKGPLLSWLARAGLAHIALSEREKVISSIALAVIVRPSDETDIASGRAFYRAWLELEAAGLAACPMSALVDDTEARARIAGLVGAGSDLRVINVLRVGYLPDGASPAPRARIPVSELII
jgi:hypothetical protein